MTKSEEAIAYIDYIFNAKVFYDDCIDHLLTKDDSEWIQEAKNALEKQIPKKPNIPWYTQKEQCPMCQRELIGQPHYCSVCGQKINWSAET